MTTFWQHIQAASQYVTGNVWDLITHPKLGGGVVVANNGCTLTLVERPMEITIDTASLSLAVSDEGLAITVANTP